MTTAPICLVPLLCIKCSQPILAQPGEVAWVCSTCNQGQILGSDGKLRPLSVFFSPEIKPGSKGKPFWVSPGQVSVSLRQTYSGNSANESASFWSQPRLFYIPAFSMKLEEIVSAGMALLRSPVAIKEAGSPMPFLPVTTGPEDARPISEFIVLAIEADRRDALKNVQFSLDLKPPQLWVLP